MEGVLQVGESLRPHLASAGRQEHADGPFIGILFFHKTILIHFGSISGIQFWVNLGQFYDLQLKQFFYVNHPKKNCNKSHGFFWASPFARGCPTRLRPLPRHRVLPAPERSAGAARHAAHSHQERGGAAGAVAARCAVAESPAVGHGGSMLFVEGLVLVR